MTAKRLDLTFEQGADYTKPIPIIDQYGNPLDVVAAALQMRTDYDDPTVLLGLDSNNGLTINTDAGALIPFVSRSVVAAILEGKYVHDVFAQLRNGNVFRLYSGFVYVCPRVTIFAFPSPSPAPAPAPAPSPAPDALQKDDGGYILQDDGSKILL